MNHCRYKDSSTEAKYCNYPKTFLSLTPLPLQMSSCFIDCSTTTVHFKAQAAAKVLHSYQYCSARPIFMFLYRYPLSMHGLLYHSQCRAGRQANYPCRRGDGEEQGTFNGRHNSCQAWFIKRQLFFFHPPPTPCTVSDCVSLATMTHVHSKSISRVESHHYLLQLYRHCHLIITFTECIYSMYSILYVFFSVQWMSCLLCFRAFELLTIICTFQQMTPSIDISFQRWGYYSRLIFRQFLKRYFTTGFLLLF